MWQVQMGNQLFDINVAICYQAMEAGMSIELLYNKYAAEDPEYITQLKPMKGWIEDAK